MIRLTIHLIAPNADEAARLLRIARQDVDATGDRLADGMPTEALTGSIVYGSKTSARMLVHTSGAPDVDTAWTWLQAKGDALAKGGEP